jgi:hypothetical protein
VSWIKDPLEESEDSFAENEPAQNNDADANANAHEDDTYERGLFQGDAGELPLDTRRALVQLLSGPFLDEQRHSKLWPVLVRDEEVIRKRLGDFFLELVIDREQKVAFTRQADTGGNLEVPHLLRQSRLTYIESTLLLYLRQQLTQADSHGGRAVVSRDDIIENMSVYDRDGNTDSAGFVKRVDAAIVKIKDRNILHKIRSSENRFEVSPVLKLLFQAEDIQKLTALYRNMAAMPESEDGEPDEQDNGEE